MQFAALDELRHQIQGAAGELSPLAMADLEDELTSWLADHGVDHDWMIAAPLAAAGVDVAWCQRAAIVLGAATLEPGLEWVAGTLSMATLLSEAKESTRRVSDLVAAVKSYSQMDRASIQRIDVTEGLESTLAMLSHKLRDSVEIVRSYDPDVPHIQAYPGELNQVSTNLIDNAADAMDGVGILRISTRADGDDVVVEVGDTGPGMPPHVAARAFDPFFTTKGADGRGGRSRPRHRPAHCGGAPWRRDRHRHPTGRDSPAIRIPVRPRNI